MKNNTLLKIEDEPDSVLLNRKGSVYAIALMIGLTACQKAQAQFVNLGGVKVSDKTSLSVNMDYINTASGSFINDGDVYIFQNWKNDGTVWYNEAVNTGKTLFTGSQQQIIEGDNNSKSNFQNVVFDNLSNLNPFDLKTTVVVGTNSDFKSGIVNAQYEDGKMIFKENASHSSAGDLSFVDGKVQKNGDVDFQFPVGNDLFFRPAFKNAGSSLSDVYTTQYFHEDSNTQYPHDKKEKSILFINNKEYWKITKDDNGEEKIVLGLTLDEDTTPSQFFNSNPNTQVAIVRWDEAKQEWVNDWGELGIEVYGQPYSHLLMGQVSGYGIFTMAIVEKKEQDTGDIVVFNAISPNDDGINDAFHIKGIDKYPDNEVEIYNRWGVKVYEAKSYNESDNMFKGYSDGRSTFKRGDKLPTGTYFYILKYNKDGKGEQKSGYLYINNQ
jgi:gliding motility-associated-like protein